MKKLLATLLIILTLSLAHTAYATNFGDLVIRSTTLGTYGAGSYFVAPLTGTIQSITFYNSGGGNVKAAILTGTGAGGFDTVVAQSSEITNVTSAGWVTIPITASVTAGTGYWLAAQTSGASNIYYDNIGGTSYMTYNNPSVYGAWGTGCGSGCLSGYRMSIYATYTNGNTFGVNQGLIGRWSFDTKDTQWDTSTSIDTSGGNNDGVLTNISKSVSQQVGKIGQAYYFDGVDDAVRMSTSLISDYASAQSTCAWFNTSVTNIQQSLVSSLLDVNNNAQLSLSSTGIIAYSYKAGGTTHGGYKPGQYVANTWTLACGVYDGSTVKVYSNAVDAGSLLSLHVNAAVNGIGKGTYGFKGYIDEVKVYNRALSSNEVQQLYRQGLATYK